MSLFTEKYNIHTHSFYCGHGSGTIAEYVRHGQKNGLRLIGFSEHCPFEDGFLYRSRMSFERMKDYERDVLSQRDEASIPVLLGYECDYFPRYRDYFSSLKDSGRVDYLITGTHFIIRKDGTRVSPFSDRLSEEDVLCYLDQMAEAIQSGLFSFIAHPDLYMAGFSQWNETMQKVAKEIIALAMEYSLPLEINANGFLKPEVDGRPPYPYEPFWQLAGRMGARAILSTDAHKVANLTRNKDRLEEFAARCNVNLIRPAIKNGQLEWDS